MEPEDGKKFDVKYPFEVDLHTLLTGKQYDIYEYILKTELQLRPNWRLRTLMFTKHDRHVSRITREYKEVRISTALIKKKLLPKFRIHASTSR